MEDKSSSVSVPFGKVDGRASVFFMLEKRETSVFFVKHRTEVISEDGFDSLSESSLIKRSH